jgi:hypothetical protein
MKYIGFMSLVRANKSEVRGIEVGTCYVFPKLDGTNASIFWDEENQTLGAGSRRRKLSEGADNAGFFNHMKDHPTAKELVMSFPTWNIYGEWLVPHSLKTYREESWRQFYIFDVWDQDKNRYLTYEEYKGALQPVLESVCCSDICIIPPMAIITNGNYTRFERCAEENTYQIEDGKGCGEGVVIKNYEFLNQFGTTPYAKLVTNLFKEANAIAFGPKEIKDEMIEQLIAEKYTTAARVEKIKLKIEDEVGPWHSKLIPRLINTTFHDIITEEMWEILKDNKKPTINFGLLHRYVIISIKAVQPDLF